MKQIKEYILEKFQITKDSKVLRKRDIKVDIDFNECDKYSDTFVMFSKEEIDELADALADNNIYPACISNKYFNHIIHQTFTTVYLWFNKDWDQKWQTNNFVSIQKRKDASSSKYLYEYEICQKSPVQELNKSNKSFNKFLSNLVKDIQNSAIVAITEKFQITK